MPTIPVAGLGRPLHVAVCMKMTPDATDLTIDPVKKTLDRSKVKNIINPPDENAFELALHQLPALSRLHPLPPPPSTLSPQPAEPQPLLQDLIASLEARRRDTPNIALKRQLHRFIKRLRRAQQDLNHVL